MKKLKVVLLDDEAPVLELLNIYLGRMGNFEIVAEFESPLVFLKQEPTLDYDLLISDVDMPEMKGTDLIKIISKPIIFVTGKASVYGSELMVAGLEASHVIGSIPKPIKFELLEKAVGKVENRISIKKNQEFLNFKTRSGFAPIRFSQIQCIATDDYLVDLGSANRKAGKGNKWLYRNSEAPLEIIDYTIEKLIKELPLEVFCQISDSEIINKSSIVFFSKLDVQLKLKILQKDKPLEKVIELGIGDKFKLQFHEFMKG